MRLRCKGANQNNAPGTNASGLIMAVLSRQQLFTEITITAVLPVMAKFTWSNVGRMVRMWAIVLAANLAGTLFAALPLHFQPVLPPQIYDGMLTVSHELLALGWWETIFRSIRRWLPDGRHGLADALARSRPVSLAGDWAWWQMIPQFVLPVLIGNVVGGTALFALLSYAQVMEEI